MLNATSFIVLLSALFLLQILDVVSAIVVLQTPDVKTNESPAKFFVKKISLAGVLLAVKVLLMAPALLALTSRPLSSMTDLLVLLGANIVYIWIVVHNFKLVYHRSK